MTELVFIDAKWDGEIKLTAEATNYIKEKNVKTIALFSSVQFTNNDFVKSQLEDLGIKVLKTKASRTSEEGQILGCDIYHNNFEQNIIEESDLIMYVGDGLFHPKALLLAQIKNPNFKDVMIFDPMAKQFQILTYEDIKPQVEKTKRNLRLYINAKTIGILVTIKPGQQYFNAAKNLKKALEKEGKKAYVFIDDSLDLNHLENYPFIDAWVNTACPRIGSDDLMKTEKALINLHEAANPIKELDELKTRD